MNFGKILKCLDSEDFAKFLKYYCGNFVKVLGKFSELREIVGKLWNYKKILRNQKVENNLKEF